MTNQNLLTGVVMLETMWEIKKKDLVDLISPFIFYSVAKTHLFGEKIDQRRVLLIVQEEFGYKDMPQAVIEKVLKRNPKYFRRIKNSYLLYADLSKEAEKLNKRKKECEENISVLGDQLAKYLESHSKRWKGINSEDAFSKLQAFFTKNGIFIGTDRLENQPFELKNNETDYHIANFLIDLKDRDAQEYQCVIDLVKGYFLQSAIYLQGNNGNLIKSTYKNVVFYLDTPFILRLLDLKSDEENKGAKELYQALIRQKGSFRYLPQAQKEIYSILTAYQHRKGLSSRVTLEGLDKLGYSSSAVDRYKSLWEKKLNIEYKLVLAESPLYAQLEDEAVDQSQLIDEKGLQDYLKSTIKVYREDALNEDIQSAISIHKLRKNKAVQEIENCEAIFVTTNVPFARKFNKYYKENVNDHTFPLLITDSDLAALTWVKCGMVDDQLPERELLRNAYMATQPSADMFDRFEQVLEQMQKEGKITEEVAIAIRSSHYTKNELLFSSFENCIDEEAIKRIHEKLKEEYSSEARENEKYKYQKALKDQKQAQITIFDKKARQYAEEKRDTQLSRERKIAKYTCLVILFIGLLGLIISLIGAFAQNFFIIPFLMVFGAISGISLADTIRTSGKRIDFVLMRRANKRFDAELEKKKKEYMDLINNDESENTVL